VAAAVAGVGGRVLQRTRFDASASRAAVRLPAPSSPAAALPVGADLGKGGAAFVTSDRDFYRVDTALTVPQVATDSYTLRIHGMVERELRLTYHDLLARPLIERYLTMACVSNPVGGPYVGTARFLGIRLADLLREAGVKPAADQIVGTSVDGMTIGTPTAVIMDGRDAMLAVGMNGQPLPLAHGFPVRMVVPGLYGYVSATKWLVELFATTFATFDGFWVQRGWAQQGVVRLESRIDTPRGFARLRRGDTVPIAGVAWQQHVGIRGVQVRIDGGAWQDARLGQVPSADTWVQWVYPWSVRGNGPVTLEVRAIDAKGEVQTGQNRDPFPSGATGYHSVVVQVG
ncbi:MAG: molybdopterin-binding oxidoreductase, partial [Jatrophihabitans sp.]